MNHSSTDQRRRRSTQLRVRRPIRGRRAATTTVDDEPARLRRRAVEVLALDDLAAQYARRLGRDVLHGFAIVVVLGLILGYLKVLADYENGPLLHVPRLSAGTALGCFGILAALITALQIAVRSGTESSPTPRRQFLAGAAGYLMLASLALGTYVGLQFLVTAPKLVEPVRMFGPLLGGVLLALLAADAAAAAEIISQDAEARKVLQEQEIRGRRRRFLALARRTGSPRCREVVVDVLYPVMLAAATVASMSAIHRVTNTLALGLLAVGVVMYIVVAWFVVYLAGVSSRVGSWGGFCVAILAAIIFSYSIGQSFVTEAISRSTTVTLAANAGWSLAAWLAFNAAAYATAVHAFRVSGRRKRRGMLLQVAARIAAGKLRRARKSPKDTGRSPANTLARWAIALCPLFPFGLVLAHAARQQAGNEGYDPLTGRKVQVAVAASWTVLALLLAALAAFATQAPVIE